jgi:hypothetical protein
VVGSIRDNSGDCLLEDLLVCFPPTAFPYLMPLLVFLKFYEHTLDKIPGFPGHGHAPWVEHPVTDVFLTLLIVFDVFVLVQTALLLTN